MSFYIETESFFIKSEKGSTASSHKYIRRFRRGGNWIYIYHKPGQEKRHIDESAIKDIKRLKELGDERAKRMYESISEVNTEKLSALRHLADAGDSKAVEYLKQNFGIDREVERLEEAVVPKLVIDRPMLAEIDHKEAVKRISSAIDASIFNYLAGYTTSPFYKNLDRKGITLKSVMDEVKVHKNLGEMMAQLETSLEKVKEAHSGLGETQNRGARGGYHKLGYKKAVEKLFGANPPDRDKFHEKFVTKMDADRGERVRKERERKEKAAREKIENAAIIEKHSESAEKMMSYFGVRYDSGKKIQLMKGMDKFFGKDFKFQQLVDDLQGHRDIEIKIGNGFVDGLASYGSRSGRTGMLSVGFQFYTRDAAKRRVNGASRTIYKNDDGSITWSNGSFGRPKNSDLERYPGMARGLYAGVEKFLLKTTENYTGAAKKNTRIEIGTAANGGFGDGYKGVLVWAKHYFDWASSGKKDSWRSSIGSAAESAARRISMNPDHKRQLLKKISQAEYPYQFARLGFKVSKADAETIIGRRLDWDFKRIASSGGGYVDIGALLMVKGLSGWGAKNYINRTTGRSGHLNEKRKVYYSGQYEREGSIKISSTASSTSASTPSTPASTPASTGSETERLRRVAKRRQERIDRIVSSTSNPRVQGIIRSWFPRRNRNISMTPQRTRRIINLPSATREELLRIAPMTPQAKRRIRSAIRDNERDSQIPTFSPDHRYVLRREGWSEAPIRIGHNRKWTKDDFVVTRVNSSGDGFKLGRIGSDANIYSPAVENLRQGTLEEMLYTASTTLPRGEV